MNLKEVLERDARLKGFADGQLRSLQVCLLTRFGKITPEIDSVISSNTEPEHMEHLIRLAVTIANLDDLLPKPTVESELELLGVAEVGAN